MIASGSVFSMAYCMPAALWALTLFSAVTNVSSKQYVTVTSAVGPIQGAVDEESNTTCFYNIPFAKPPIG